VDISRAIQFSGIVGCLGHLPRPRRQRGVVAGAFTVREMNVSNTNILFSENFFTIAQDLGWWSPVDGTKMDFSTEYSDGEVGQMHSSGRQTWKKYC